MNEKTLKAILHHWLDTNKGRSRKRDALYGLYIYLDGSIKADEGWEQAIREGAENVVIPGGSLAEETGRVRIVCCAEFDVDLSIHDHQVWKCPNCGRLWALTIEFANVNFLEVV